jgi:SAM-dependent methyltransferase
MHYDPIKKSLGEVFNKHPFLRILFYKMLDLLLLRTWHIKREINKWDQKRTEKTHILDAGSGFGQYTYYLASKNKNWNILAVDVKDEQISDCNNFFLKINLTNAVFKIADLTKFVKENCFELILSVDVMEHILEDELVFQNFHKSLKEGGMLLISTPSDQGGSDVHDSEDGSFIDEHVRDGYNAKDIEDKLKRAGFSRVNVLYSYGTPGKISWRLSMKYPMLALNTSKLFFILLPFYYLLFFPICLVLNYLDTVTPHRSGTGLIVKAWK